MPSFAHRLRAAAGGLPATFWWLWGGVLVNRLAGFVVPFLALYLTRQRGFTPAQAGVAVAVFGAGVVASGPVSGLLADRVGRRRVMLAGLGGGGLLAIALGFLEARPLLLGAAFLLGFVGELYRPPMHAAVGDVVAPAERARAFGLLYWAANLGVAVGLVLAGAVADRSLRALFVGDGLTSLAFGAMIFLRVPETRPAPSGGRAPRATAGELLAAWADPTFARLLGLYLAFLLVFMQLLVTLPLDMGAKGLSPGAYGLAMAVNGALIVVLQPLAAPVLRRLDPARVLAAGALLAGVGFGLNAVARTLPAYAAAVAVWTLGEIGSLPVASALAVELAPAHLRGRYQGAASSCWGIANLAAPTVGTLVLGRLGAPALWGGCLAVDLVVAGGYLALARALRARRATDQTAMPDGQATPVPPSPQ